MKISRFSFHSVGAGFVTDKTAVC